MDSWSVFGARGSRYAGQGSRLKVRNSGSRGSMVLGSGGCGSVAQGGGD